MSKEHLRGALIRARRAIDGIVIPPKSLELVHSEEMGDPDKGNFRLKEILIGFRTVEVRTRNRVVVGDTNSSTTLDHERTERLSEGVHSIRESWATLRNTGSRISATGEELNENTEWRGCGCRFNCTHRKAFRKRMADLGIDWKG